MERWRSRAPPIFLVSVVYRKGRGERRRSPRPLMSAERGQQPVGQREQDEAREDRPAERGTALAVHFRNQVRRRHVDRDAGGHGERVPTWCSATKPVAIAPASVSTPRVAPAPSAAAGECPPASMTDAIVKPSGTLCRTTAMERSAPSAGPIMKPAAIATPSKDVCTPAARDASQPAAGSTSASGWTSSPKWKWGATVCSKRWTPK